MPRPEDFPEALIERYLDGTISEADRKLLMDWFDGFSDQEVTVLSSRHQSIVALKESIWESIERRNGVNRETALAKIPGGARRIDMHRYRRLVGIVAACLVLAGGLWWSTTYFSDTDNRARTKTVQSSGIGLLEHSGAVLTLANGETVALDSAGTGQVAVQGGARIMQQGGQLRYLEGGSTAATATALYRNTVATPRGKQFALILPDGTKAWLNAASSVSYPVPFARDRRSVTVTGEVYFEVAHLTAADHKTRIPFEVRSGRLQIEVLGTHFDIQNYTDDRQIKTTLLEGSVALHYANGPGTTIRPGQQATIDRAGSGRIAVDEVDTRQAIAWKSGLFFFKEEPLGDILRQVARWYDVETDADPSKLKLRFSGVVSKRARLTDLLEVLSATGVVQFKINENKVYGY